MTLIAIDTNGILSNSYGSLPNESHVLQAPAGMDWTLFADGNTGDLTLTDGASGPASYVLYDANNVAWNVIIDDNGLLSIIAFDATIVLAPAVNMAVKVNGVPAVGYELHAYQAGTSLGAVTYKNGLFISTQPNPILLNAYGLPTDPVFILVGTYYDFQLVPPGGGTPLYTWHNVSAGIPTNINNPTEWIQPAIPARYVSPGICTVVGDQRLSLKPGRRIYGLQSSSATMYGTISSASYDGTMTTVTCSLNLGAFDTTLQTIAAALINPPSSVLPSRRSSGNDVVLNGPLTVPTASGFNLLPMGIIDLVHTIPAGWLKCDGSAVSRTTYGNLMQSINAAETGTTTNTSAVVTGLSDTSRLNTGMKVSGTGIPAATVINSIDSPTQVTLSLAATASGTVPLLFSNFGIGDGSTTFNVPNLTPPANLFYAIYAQV